MGELRRQRLWQLGAAGLFAVIVVGVVIVVSQAGSDSLEHLGADRRSAAELFAKIPQSGQYLGDPKAPATLVEYADLQCPFCREFTLDSLPTIIDRYVRPGKLRLRFEPQTFIGADSVPAARMALAAGGQDRLWQFADLFYRSQEEENSGYVTDEFLRKLATATPDLNVRRALATEGSPGVTQLLDRSKARFESAGFNSTPSFELEQGATRSKLTVTDPGSPTELTEQLDAELG